MNKKEMINRISAIFIQLVYIVLAVGILVYYFGFADEVNYKNVSKAIIFLVVYVIFWVINRAKRGRIGYKELAERYKGITEGVFIDNKGAYNQFMKALSLYDIDQYNKSIHILEKLENKCKKTADYSAVYYMKAICYRALYMVAQAITSYEMLLKYDLNNSVAWSNLGLLYQDCSNMEKAYEAYRNAIRSNPLNHFAYNNMAMYYVDVADWNEAEYYALKALELDPNMHQAMEKLAIVYKMTGDNLQFEKYRKLYAINGGNVKQLDEYLDSI